VQQISGPTNGWLIARSQAQGLIAPNGASVDLATITSSAEDQFIFAGIDTPSYWSIDSAGNNEGPNLGGYQFDKLNEPAGNWAWVTGEPWSYTRWNPGEPNNSGEAEDYLTFFGTGSARSGNWNDIGASTTPVGSSGSINYYVAESVPEPSLNIMLDSTNLAFSWPTNAQGFTLESSTNLLTGSWSAVTNGVVIMGTNYFVSFNPTQAQGFFRLKK